MIFFLGIQGLRGLPGAQGPPGFCEFCNYPGATAYAYASRSGGTNKGP